MDRAAAYRPTAGVRWDKVARLVMLVVLAVLLALYVRSGISLWNTWQSSRADSAKVVVLQAQSASLKRQRSELHARWATEAQARRLGMAHRGEKAYVIRGLPDN